MPAGELSERRIVTLGRERDTDRRPLREYVAAAVAGVPPTFAWLEPDPIVEDAGSLFDATRLPSALNARGLAFTSLLDAPLLEARLFWPDRAIHACRVGSATRWVEIAEGPEGITVERTTRPVAERRDAARFGNPLIADGAGDAELVEYWTGKRLVAWRLAPLVGGR